MEMNPEVFAAVLTESVQKSLEKNRYGKAVTVNVSVEKITQENMVFWIQR